MNLFSNILPKASECLAHGEVELAAAASGRTRGGVESPTPVEAEQAHDGQVEPYAQTGRTLDLEGRETLPRVESVAPLEEAEDVDLRRLLQYNGITPS